ncbi:hypothetical protein [Streptomyces sp. A1136]|uniref:hypothetical protein n=1 Tax=Streptomyces sp. A1136 TaxID=2563102 RepID=UPI00109EA018|nr:hypothetical protein [Streptomyces sp. A1136]THA45673.1 hypothetical protein E6R62_35315 [Streptomyces sp. A1136]
MAITVYSHVFDTNSAFPDAQILLFDDAHAAENYEADAWAVRSRPGRDGRGQDQGDRASATTGTPPLRDQENPSMQHHPAVFAALLGLTRADSTVGAYWVIGRDT